VNGQQADAHAQGTVEEQEVVMAVGDEEDEEEATEEGPPPPTPVPPEEPPPDDFSAAKAKTNKKFNVQMSNARRDVPAFVSSSAERVPTFEGLTLQELRAKQQMNGTAQHAVHEYPRPLAMERRSDARMEDRNVMNEEEVIM
jgi:hypothetical protein